MLSEENREHLYNFDSTKLNFKRFLKDLYMERIDKLNFIKIKNLYSSNNTITPIQSSPHVRENMQYIYLTNE